MVEVSLPAETLIVCEPATDRVCSGMVFSSSKKYVLAGWQVADDEITFFVREGVAAAARHDAHVS